MSEILPSATVILLRDTKEGLQTLILRRNSKLGFAGGMWVFPGGKIEAEELSAAVSQIEAARLAAVRETREEAQLEVEASSLVYYSHWTTPPHMPKRFSTWFFAAHAPDQQDVVIDGSEIHDHQWIAPARALALHALGEVELLPPTVVTLTEMAQCDHAEAFLARSQTRANAGQAPVFEPHFVVSEGKPTVAMYAGDAGYDDHQPEAPGPRHRCLLADGCWTYINDCWPW